MQGRDCQRPGVVESRELLQVLLNGKDLDFGKLSPNPPHYVPGTLSLIGLLEFFKANQTQTALVANEFGATEGLVTLSDLMGTVVGDVLSGAVESPLAIQRGDGSWLLDGLLAIDEMKQLLGIKELPEEDLGNFHTVGGFVIVHLGRIPKKTESFDWGDWHSRSWTWKRTGWTKFWRLASPLCPNKALVNSPTDCRLAPEIHESVIPDA